MNGNNEWQNSVLSMKECIFHLYANKPPAGRSEDGNKSYV
jgi:hypothetical protein